jgi:hypothetical protein
MKTQTDTFARCERSQHSTRPTTRRTAHPLPAEEEWGERESCKNPNVRGKCCGSTLTLTRRESTRLALHRSAELYSISICPNRRRSRKSLVLVVVLVLVIGNGAVEDEKEDEDDLVAAPPRYAVSQSCTLPAVGKRRRVGPIPRLADCKSAIRQIENLYRLARIIILTLGVQLSLLTSGCRRADPGELRLGINLESGHTCF